MPGETPDLKSLLAAAQAARKRGDAGGELRLLDEALRCSPSDPQALNARGMRALADRDWSGATRAFGAAAAADPREPALLMNLAAAHRGAGDDAAERAALDRALAIDRIHLMAQLRMAELNQRTGRVTAAVQGWQGVLQLASAIDPLPPGLARLLDGGRAFLADQVRKMGAALDTRFAEEVALAGIEGTRIRACIDHTLGRRPIYRNECAGVHYPFLPAIEFFEREQFPWLSHIEARTDAIRREALALIADSSDAIRPYVRQDAGTPQNKWTPLDGSLDWSACFLWEHGVRNDPVCARCPETAAALESLPQTDIPGKAPSAFFSLLRPRAHIPAHTGVTNTRTIVHLPLVVPEGCRFRVGGETRAWRVGEAFAFDDTIEHEAWNDSNALRIVLIFDVWNPYLTPRECQFLRGYLEASAEE